MIFRDIKVLGHFVVLCSVLNHASGQQQVNQLVQREPSVQPREFLLSCVDWGTLKDEKYNMAAYCRTTTGNWTWSVLDLNHCLVNNNGTLIAQDEGYFFLTADSCSSDNATTSWANYKCSTTAIERSGGNIDHDIDLNGVVGNDNGTLVCGSHAYKGRVLSQEQVHWSKDGIVVS
ncbi:hypothetical protein CGGC5_v005821 [Colletotrichum fructicola Nara gc5]|uniref:Cyanovirin-N domain-containing protein n=1 Tax=Colletotrichum fructicola (strain Nara gc5) TaxID=1213859 RepID=A0A7J6J8X2_COLFN|nr:hypothetical protein CGGC5_v005821 [Colletotrichum fructicola Nara gc5]